MEGEVIVEGGVRVEGEVIVEGGVRRVEGRQEKRDMKELMERK